MCKTHKLFSLKCENRIDDLNNVNIYNLSLYLLYSTISYYSSCQVKATLRLTND